MSDLGGSPSRHGIGMGTREGSRHSGDCISSHMTAAPIADDSMRLSTCEQLQGEDLGVLDKADGRITARGSDAR